MIRVSRVGEESEGGRGFLTLLERFVPEPMAVKAAPAPIFRLVKVTDEVTHGFPPSNFFSTLFQFFWRQCSDKCIENLAKYRWFHFTDKILKKNGPTKIHILGKFFKNLSKQYKNMTDFYVFLNYKI